MKRSQVWSTFAQSKPSANKPPSINIATESVCSKLDIKQSPILKQILQSEFRQYQKHVMNQRKLKSGERQEISGEDKIVISRMMLNEGKEDDPEIDSESEPVAKKTFYKPFLDLSNYRKRCRTDELIDSLRCFIEKEKMMDENKVPLTISQLLGYLLHRVNYEKEKKLANIGAMIMNGEDITTNNAFDITDAITLMHDMTLSKEQLRVMRRYLVKKGMFFPSTNSLLEARKNLKPVISPILEGKGVAVDYIDLTKMTTASVFDTINQKLDESLDTSVEYKMFYKDGGDGSGSQTVLKSKSAVGTAQNIFQYSLVPLRLESCTSEVIWRNPAANGASWVRPVFLIREKEDEVSLLNHVVSYTDKCRDLLNSKSIEVTSFRQTEVYQVKHTINDTMKDLKFKKLLCGLGGADCILCDSKQNEWMNVERIQEGFHITRSAQETLEIYNQLVTADGEITSSKNDYDSRKGLTQRPLSTSDQLSITITHSYINITNWFVKVLSRMNMEYEHWVEKKNCYGDPIRAGNTNVLQILEGETGLRVDQVCGPTGKGGGSTDGNQGRRFFSLSSFQSILNCIPEKYHEVVRELHQNLSCILQIISSKLYQANYINYIKQRWIFLKICYNQQVF